MNYIYIYILEKTGILYVYLNNDDTFLNYISQILSTDKDTIMCVLVILKVFADNFWMRLTCDFNLHCKYYK